MFRSATGGGLTRVDGVAQWRIQGWCATAPVWRDRELVDICCTAFVNFVSRLNREIRVQRFLVTVRVFCLLKTASKLTQTCHFCDKNDFWWGGQPPLPHPKKPRCLRPSPRYLLTEILDRLKFYYLVDLIDTYGIKEAQLFLTNSTISSFLPIGFTYISQFYLPILQWIHGVRLFYDAM